MTRAQTAWRCERCGKFRKAEDIAQYDVGDQATHDVVTECRWCMPPATAKQFGMEPA
ncbi:hypothetical protein QDA02_gp22 [Microbacterium phage Margaery]|uniref:Uncharacterized protein n=1 Tax=Microbacterium phage Margaery TaxID=2591217 RepID=A0A514DHR1_9CAUD|nr:hypothetical protein QDA02_gp22 [Microbacterium phage Margaery]QDH93143.1 hypothetical protein PBI_MARGAERY_86 [Microbacterium phage Margaery]